MLWYLFVDSFIAGESENSSSSHASTTPGLVYSPLLEQSLPITLPHLKSVTAAFVPEPLTG
jgi:hypothetical protein